MALITTVIAQVGPEGFLSTPLPLGTGGLRSGPITFPTCRPIVLPQAELVYPRFQNDVPPEIGILAVSVLVEGIPWAQITLKPISPHLPVISVRAHEDQDSSNPFRSDLHATLPVLSPNTRYLLHLRAHDGTTRCGAKDYEIDFGEIDTASYHSPPLR